jgi:hypothetical protein
MLKSKQQGDRTCQNYTSQENLNKDTSYLIYFANS